MKPQSPFFKTACAIWLLLALPAVAPASQINDNFATATNWGAPVSQGGNLSIGGGRMNYTSSSTLNTIGGAAIARNTPLLPTTNDWSLKVDAHIYSFTLITNNGQFSSVSLGFGKTGDWDNTHVMIDFGRGWWDSINNAHYGFNIQDDVRINGVDVPWANKVFNAWNLPSGDVSLRLDYSAVNHTVTYYFDGDGAANGYNWVAQGSANLASGIYNLNLSATDTFTITLTGSSGYQNVADGQAYLTNLVITMNQSPAVTTGTGVAIDSTSATVSGTINPNGLSATVQFEYGLTTTYGNTASITLSASNGVTAQAVIVTLIGLQPDTTYHYRLTGFNGGGVGLGGDAVFVTPTEFATGAWIQSPPGPGINSAVATAVDGNNDVVLAGDMTVIKYSNSGVPLWTNFNAIGYFRTMKLDNSNNVIVMGSGIMIKYSSAGLPLWTNILSRLDQANSIAIDKSNNVIITGSASTDIYASECVTIKYSGAGIALWTNSCQIPGYLGNFGDYTAVDGSNNIIVLGTIDPNTGGVRTDIVTIKYSSAGVPVWTNIYNGVMNLDDSPVAIAVDGSNNVIIAGSTQITSGSAGYSTGVVIKYTSAGVPVWVNRISSGIDGDYLTAMTADSDNNIIVAGAIYGGNGSLFMTIKYSSAGLLLWANYSYSTGGYGISEWASDMAVDGNNNVIVTGSSGNYYYYDFLTIKYSSTGTNIWTKIYDGGGTSDNALAIAVDHGNGVIVAGISSLSGGSDANFTLVKYVSATIPGLVVASSPAGLPQIRLSGTSGIYCDIEKSANLVDWVYIGRAPVGVNLDLGQIDPAWRTASNGFFRVALASSQQSLPPSISSQPVGLTASAGDGVSFGVAATGSLPLQYQWQLNSTNIAGATNAWFEIANFQISQAGPYSVIVANAAGSVTSSNALLTVSVPFTYTMSNGAITITGYTGSGRPAAIPDTINGLPVVSIGDWAFYQRVSLTNLTIGNNVTSIGNSAFRECANLTTVIIGNSVNSIGNQAFFYCSGLANITIPNSVTNIGIMPFYGCSRLTWFQVGASNPAYSSLSGVLFDKGQTTLLNYPMSKGGTYVIPNSVTNISDYAFVYCANMSSLTIGTNITSIGYGMFAGCAGLTNVLIPNSVTNIGLGGGEMSEAFYGCSNLIAITVAASNPVYGSVSGVLLDRNQTTLFRCPEGKGGNFTIPNGINNIYSGAFSYCQGLNSVTIPNGVVTIGDYAFNGCVGMTGISIPASVTNIGYSAFGGCNGLTAITVDPNNLNYSSVDGVLFDKSKSNLIQFPAGKSGNYTVPQGVSSIRNTAFVSCIGLASITCPGSVTNIDSWAIYGCTNLTGIYFRGNAPLLGGSYAFYSDNSPNAYYMPATTGWSDFSTISGLQVVLWNPQAIEDASFGVRTNRFGFNIIGGSNLVMVVEASTNLANWLPVSTNTLNTFIGTNGTSYFSDPQWTNYPGRYYRLRSP